MYFTKVHGWSRRLELAHKNNSKNHISKVYLGNCPNRIICFNSRINGTCYEFSHVVTLQDPFSDSDNDDDDDGHDDGDDNPGDDPNDQSKGLDIFAPDQKTEDQLPPPPQWPGQWSLQFSNLVYKYHFGCGYESGHGQLPDEASKLCMACQCSVHVESHDLN